MLAALVLIPIVNLLTPLFGVALMVHVHKRLAARRLTDRRPGTPPRLEVGPGPG
jgi:CysZ protein